MNNRNSALLLATPLIAVALSVVDDKSYPCDIALVPGPLKGKAKKATSVKFVPSKSGQPVTDKAVLNAVAARIAEHVHAQNKRQSATLELKALTVSLAKEEDDTPEAPAKPKRTRH